MIQIFIANYKPEFSDGRVQRVMALEEHLRSKSIAHQIISFGPTSHETFDEIKLRSFILKYFLRSHNRIEKTMSKISLKSLLYNKLRILLTKISVPDIYVYDVLLNYRKVKKIRKPGATVILSVPWFSLLLFSRVFRNNYLILDFRDLYIDNPLFQKFSVLDRFIFKHGLRNANEIWVTTAPAKKILELGTSKVVKVVPNGVSESMITKIRLANQMSSGEKLNLRIGYFGNLGGQRQFTKFFENCIRSDNVSVVGAGNFDAAHAEIFGQQYLGFLDKDELYSNINTCDIIIVCITKDEHSDYAIPAKIYEALCFGRPILLNAPVNSAAQQLLESLCYPFLMVSGDDCPTFDEMSGLAANLPTPIIYNRNDQFNLALEDGCECVDKN